MWFNFIAALGDGLVGASVVVPFFIGATGRTRKSAIEMGWLLFFGGCLYNDLLGPLAISLIWSSSEADAVTPDQPTTIPAFFLGWIPGLAMFCVGFVIRRSLRFLSGLRKS